MKGKVLGFDAASGTGAINGENGQRYSFTAAEFKSPAPAKPNDNVDFEVDGANAKNIYVTAGAMPNVDSPPSPRTRLSRTFLPSPMCIWAAVIILGSLIAGYFNTLGALGDMSGPYGSGLGISAIFIALLFAVPVVAAVLIFFEFTNHKITAQFRLLTAAVAIGGPILLPVLAGLTAPEMLRGMREMGAAFGGAGRMGILEFIGFGDLAGHAHHRRWRRAHRADAHGHR